MQPSASLAKASASSSSATAIRLASGFSVSNIPCRVVGLLAAKGYSGFGTDQDNVIFMPLATFQRRIAGNDNVDTIFVSAANGVSTSSLQTSIEEIMREIRHVSPGRQDDFEVRDMTQIAQTMASATSVMTGMLGAVAAVSLLVGGIGIMNIMLVSVTERTREIGIRLAIGAHERHILTQFLVEATVLSLIGGIAGVLLGLGIAGLASVAMSVPFVAEHTGHIARRRLLRPDRHRLRLLPGAERRPA